MRKSGRETKECSGSPLGLAERHLSSGRQRLQRGNHHTRHAARSKHTSPSLPLPLRWLLKENQDPDEVFTGAVSLGTC